MPLELRAFILRKNKTILYNFVLAIDGFKDDKVYCTDNEEKLENFGTETFVRENMGQAKK